MSVMSDLDLQLQEARDFMCDQPPETQLEYWSDQMAKTYDPKCYDLAARFLDDEPGLNKSEAARTSLAIAIQQVIEDEIQFMRMMMEKGR